MADNLPSKQSPPRQLFPTENNVFGGLTPTLTDEQRQELALHVAKKKVELDEFQKKAEIKHVVASAEMANAIQAVDILDKTTKDDYKYEQSFDTGSGNAKLKVERNKNYNGMLLAAVALAALCVLILVALSKIK